MRFSYTAVVTALSIAVVANSPLSSCDAFVVPQQQPNTLSSISRSRRCTVKGTVTTANPSVSLKMAGGEWDNNDFLDGLSSSPSPTGDGSEKSKQKKKNDDDEDEQDPDEPASGSSRFKELMSLAKAGGVGGAGGGLGFGGRAVENPFLSQSYSPLPPLTPIANLDEMSVEEQARRFREMMQQGGGVPRTDTIPPPPQRVSKTDRAGRPVGRNRDADTIANTADLYFAQLKRDSTVRTIARLRDDIETAEAVFADEGVRALDELLVKNPYLKGQQEKERALIDTIPEEAIRQYFDGKPVTEEEKQSAGISYRKKLMERRQKLGGGDPPSAQIPTTPPPQQMQGQPTQYITSSPPSQQTQAPSPQPQQSVQIPPPLNPPISIEPPSSQSAGTSQTQLSPDESRQKIRTLMGMILKHRGGPGFGKGRLKGSEIERFSNLLNEVIGMLRNEAQQGGFFNTDSVSAVTAPPPKIQQVPAPPPPAAASAFAPAASATTSMDSTLACIDGAITMYKNSPPQLKGSVLFTLRAALASAVEVCDSVSTMPPLPSVPGGSGGQIDSTIAVIEGAVSMYRNSPPQLQQSVLVTLRAALVSAIDTCDAVLGNTPSQVGTASSAVATASSASVPVQDLPQPPITPTSAGVSTQQASYQPPQQQQQPTVKDPNTIVLESIYESVKSAHGDGKLGLRSDITPEEASQLADQLIEMRSMLMGELEAGIPDPGSEPKRRQQASRAVSTSSSAMTSTGSKYQQMLAKAKAQKADNQ